MMQVDARISKEWRRRMIFMFIMIFGSGVWFLTDGYIMWPAEAKRFEIYDRIAQNMILTGEAKDKKDPVLAKAWAAYAKENNMSEKVPKHRSAGDLAGQRWPGWIFFSGSMVFAGWVAWNHRLSVTAEGDVITGASGQKVHLDSIVAIDRRKWDNKGIAYAIYEEDGKTKRLTLDDHKFLGCEAIILEADRRIEARNALKAEKEAAG